VPPPVSEPIGLLLARTAKVVSRAFDDALSHAGGSLPMWLVLVSLKSSEHGAQRDLARAVGIEGPTLTHHLNRMEAAGLITRTRRPDNRRVHDVTLTETGEATFQHLRSTVATFDEQLRAGLTTRELATISRFLKRLQANAADSRDEDRADVSPP
jgi:MarR family transcriptional regulator, transcriptional regulator for hemolysin